MINFLIGEVKIKVKGGKWEDAKLGIKLYSHDRIKTGNESEVELLLPDNNIIKLLENTELEIIELSENLNTGAKINKLKDEIGRIIVNVKKFSKGRDLFEINTDIAVAGVRGTIFEVNVKNDKTTVVSVIEGEVEVIAYKIKGKPRQIIKGCKKVIVKPKEPPSEPFPLKPDEIKFIKEKISEVRWKRIQKEETFSEQPFQIIITSPDKRTWNTPRKGAIIEGIVKNEVKVVKVTVNGESAQILRVFKDGKFIENEWKFRKYIKLQNPFKNKIVIKAVDAKGREAKYEFELMGLQGIPEFYEVDKLPKPLKIVPPVYPKEYEEKKKEGVVFLIFKIDTTGEVKDVFLLETNLDSIFVKAAIDAVKQWKFKPAFKSGKKVPVWMEQPIEFKNKNNDGR